MSALLMAGFGAVPPPCQAESLVLASEGERLQSSAGFQQPPPQRSELCALPQANGAPQFSGDDRWLLVRDRTLGVWVLDLNGEAELELFPELLGATTFLKTAEPDVVVVPAVRDFFTWSFRALRLEEPIGETVELGFHADRYAPGPSVSVSPTGEHVVVFAMGEIKSFDAFSLESEGTTLVPEVPSGLWPILTSRDVWIDDETLAVPMFGSAGPSEPGIYAVDVSTGSWERMTPEEQTAGWITASREDGGDGGHVFYRADGAVWRVSSQNPITSATRLTPYTTEDLMVSAPFVSPDGSRLAFCTRDDPNTDDYSWRGFVVDSDGSVGDVEELALPGGSLIRSRGPGACAVSFSPDSSSVLVEVGLDAEHAIPIDLRCKDRDPGVMVFDARVSSMPGERLDPLIEGWVFADVEGFSSRGDFFLLTMVEKSCDKPDPIPDGTAPNRLFTVPTGGSGLHGTGRRSPTELRTPLHNGSLLAAVEFPLPQDEGRDEWVDGYALALLRPDGLADLALEPADPALAMEASGGSSEGFGLDLNLPERVIGFAVDSQFERVAVLIGKNVGLEHPETSLFVTGVEAPEVTFDPAPGDLREGDTVTLGLLLSQPQLVPIEGRLAVRSASSPSDDSGTDDVIVESLFRFSPGETTTSVEVTARFDEFEEPVESVEIFVKTATCGAVGAEGVTFEVLDGPQALMWDDFERADLGRW